MQKERLKLNIEGTDTSIKYDMKEGRSCTDSLYSELKSLGMPSVWRQIKEELFEKEGRKCWICGAKNGRLNAHEFWKYSPVKEKIIKTYTGKPIRIIRGKKKLTAIRHLCGKCHAVKHFDCFYLSQKEAEEEKSFLALCKKRPRKELERKIEAFLKKPKTHFTAWNEVTEEKIKELKKYLKEACSQRKEREKRIKGRRKLTEDLIKHFCKVNHCSRKVFERHWKNIQKKKRKIQDHHGVQHQGAMEPDYGRYKKLLESCYEKYWKKHDPEYWKRYKALKKSE